MIVLSIILDNVFSLFRFDPTESFDPSIQVLSIVIILVNISLTAILGMVAGYLMTKNVEFHSTNYVEHLIAKLVNSATHCTTQSYEVSAVFHEISDLTVAVILFF